MLNGLGKVKLLVWQINFCELSSKPYITLLVVNYGISNTNVLEIP